MLIQGGTTDARSAVGRFLIYAFIPLPHRTFLPSLSEKSLHMQALVDIYPKL